MCIYLHDKNNCWNCRQQRKKRYLSELRQLMLSISTTYNMATSHRHCLYKMNSFGIHLSHRRKRHNSNLSKQQGIGCIRHGMSFHSNLHFHTREKDNALFNIATLVQHRHQIRRQMCNRHRQSPLSEGKIRCFILSVQLNLVSLALFACFFFQDPFAR